MSIRQLTARLINEAVEAQRRKNNTAAADVSWDSVGHAGLRKHKVALDQNAFALGGQSTGSDMSPALKVSAEGAWVADSPSTMGIRPRPEKSQWKIPGGIAARFGLGGSDPNGEVLDHQEKVHVPELQVGTDVSSSASTTDSDNREDPQAKEQETTPITIELQSH